MKENCIYEVCPHCDSEVLLLNKFERQKCPLCNKDILPCSICENEECNKCKLGKISREWIDIFWEEKGIENRLITIEHKDNIHMLSTLSIKNLIKKFTEREQKAIKEKLIEIDFYNGNVYDFLEYIALGHIEYYFQ